MSLKKRLLGSAFRLGRYYAWWVLLFFVLLTGFGIYYARDVPLRSSLFDLLPTDDPVIDEYRRNAESVESSDAVAILLTLVDEDLLALSGGTGEAPAESNEDDDFSPQEQAARAQWKAHLLAAAERIKVLLDSDEEFSDVQYLHQMSPEIPDQYLPLFELGDEDLLQIEASVLLARDAIAGGGELAALPEGIALGGAYRAISLEFSDALYAGTLTEGLETGGLPGVEEQLAAIQALNDAVLGAIEALPSLPPVTTAVERLSGIFAPSEVAASREPEPFISRDGLSLLMMATPRLSSREGVEYSRLVSDKIRDAATMSGAEENGVHVGITGTYPFNAMTNEVVNADMLRTTIISSVGVFVIFFLAFGSVFYSVIAVIPLLVSVILTMCWAKAVVGGFNLVTTFLPALVLGLGIDYAIHLISRYAEERRKGRSLNRALYTSVLNKGTASFFAAMTTSLVFVGLLSARSRALFEMGAISSVGVAIAFLVTLLLFPAMITLAHYIPRRRRRGSDKIASHAAKLGGFYRFVTGRGRAICAITLVLTFFVAFQAARTSFVFSSTDLVPRVESQDVYDRIVESFAASPASIGSYFTFFASTETELREVVTRLSEHELVEEIDSAVTYLPVDLTAQQKTLNGLDIASYVEQLRLLEASLDERPAILSEVRGLLAQFALLQYGATMNGFVDIAFSSSDILAQLREIRMQLDGLDVERATEEVAALRGALVDLDENLAGVRNLQPVETLLREILMAFPEAIWSQYLTAEGDFIVRARVPREIYDGDNLAAFDAYAASFSDNYFGMPLVSQKLEDYMMRDFYISTGIAVGLIMIVLWVSLRGWMKALLAAAPLLLGYIWMLGGMRLMAIDFNFLSITISPLLIGIGVDNGIHILHRTMEERSLDPNGAIERGASTTAVAVIVTSLTTMLVFGSLILARTPGLRYLGISALLGIGFSLVFGILFLPAALRVEGGRRV